MNTIVRLSLLAFVAVAIACTPTTTTNTNTVTNTNTNAAPRAAAPTQAALLTMENNAWEAWKNRDTKHFEGLMADNFVGYEKGNRMSKAEMIKVIGEHKCEIKSFALSDPRMTPVGSDVVVLTYKGTADGTCEAQKIPSAVTAASVYVRTGDAWKAAYHGEVQLMEQQSAVNSNTNGANTSASEAAGAEKKAPPTLTNSNTAANSNAAATSTGDALTDALMAVERRGWDAWMRQDAKGLEETTGSELGFVDSGGRATFGKAEVIKQWTDGSCKVSSVDVSNGKATLIANNVALLTFKGNPDATCGGSKLPPVWGTTVAMKDGETWKAYYLFQVPAV